MTKYQICPAEGHSKSHYRQEINTQKCGFLSHLDTTSSKTACINHSRPSAPVPLKRDGQAFLEKVNLSNGRQGMRER